MSSKSLRPFFSFFGSKWRLAANKYPPPEYRTIIEPFAGSAGYSLRYPDRQVTLIDKDPVVAGVWNWLITASPEDVKSLPEVKEGESLDAYDMPEAARWLVGFWIGQADMFPRNKCSKFGAVSEATGENHCAVYIRRALEQIPAIRHWVVNEDDYSNAPDVMATWFVDPPYSVKGRKYRFGPDKIDYPSLAEWCKNRTGQVIVCENDGASWLPFNYLSDHAGFTTNGVNKKSVEVCYLQNEAETV